MKLNALALREMLLFVLTLHMTVHILRILELDAVSELLDNVATSN